LEQQQQLELIVAVAALREGWPAWQAAAALTQLCEESRCLHLHLQLKQQQQQQQ
jgi:hypothetical protein